MQLHIQKPNKNGCQVLKLGWNKTKLKGNSKTIWESTSSFNMFLKMKLDSKYDSKVRVFFLLVPF